MDDPGLDPSATFLHIQQRLRECRVNGTQMSHLEAVQHFHSLLHACSQLISENDKLRRAVAISDQIVEELEIEMTIKDIEIFNFTTQQERNDE